MSQVHAKALFGTVDKYLDVKNQSVIEIGSNEIEDDGRTASYYDYRDSKRKTIDMNDVSKSTREEIAGVKAGEAALVTTLVANSKTETVSRYCEVFYVFENKQAYVGCKSTKADYIPGYQFPERFDFIINNVENITAEVAALDSFSKGETAELRIDTENAKAGRNVKILAIFANGEALVQKIGFNQLDTAGIVYKRSVDRVQLSDLNKLN
jgi:hypothetical protein